MLNLNGQFCINCLFTCFCLSLRRSNLKGIFQVRGPNKSMYKKIIMQELDFLSNMFRVYANKCIKTIPEYICIVLKSTQVHF